MGTYLKMLRNSENPELKKAAEDLINKWKVILHKPSKQNKPNKPTIKIEDYFLEGENASKKRNNIRKNLYIYLEQNLTDKEDEDERKKLMEKSVQIEEKLYETLKGDSPYTNRALEILHNLKDQNNQEFRNNIISGKLTPEDLCTMDPIDMLDKNKQKEIESQINKKVDEARSDWLERHSEVTEGVYKCRNCGQKRTVQHEQQTRSADEPMTIFITCVNCKNTWKI